METKQIVTPKGQKRKAKKERGQEKKRRHSMTENPEFSMSCTKCYEVLFTTYGIVSNSLCIPLVE